MKRLLARLFPEKPYGCGCGKNYRTATEQGKCAWKHALEA